MNLLKVSLACGSLALLLILGPMVAPTAQISATADWQKTVQQCLRVYGHRNWIIVSDAAFPAYSQAGMETIVANQDLPAVLNYVAHEISSSKHVRANAFLDQELQFVQETDYPGVTHLREQIINTFNKTKLSNIPHTEVLSKIDDAGKTFRVLFIKTSTTIPYTSVYMRLDCGYMTDEVENKIRNSIAASPVK